MLSVGALSPCLCTFWAYVVWIAIGDKLNQHFSFLYFTVLFYLIRIIKNFIFYSFTTKLHDSMKYLFAKRKVDPINGDYKAIRCNKKISSCMYSHGISPPITVSKSAPFCCARVIAICRFRDGITYSKRRRRTVSF